MHLIAMAKMGNSKYDYNQQTYTAKELVTNLEMAKKLKRSRKYAIYYYPLKVSYKGHRIQLFFCKNGQNAKWRLLLSSDETLKFEEVFRVYAIRWLIEVFFKDAKQELYLNCCQSTDFDAQIAHLSLVMIRYSIINTYKHSQAYSTFGKALAQSEQDLSTLSLVYNIDAIIESIASLIIEVLHLDCDFNQIIPQIIQSEKYRQSIYTILKATQPTGIQ